MLYFDATQILNSRIIVSVRGYEAEERALLEFSNLLLGFGDAIVVAWLCGIRVHLQVKMVRQAQRHQLLIIIRDFLHSHQTARVDVAQAEHVIVGLLIGAADDSSHVVRG